MANHDLPTPCWRILYNMNICIHIYIYKNSDSVKSLDAGGSRCRRSSFSMDRERVVP